MAISGIGLAYATAGGILLWSGLKGEPVAQTIKELARGQQPTGTNTQEITLASAPSGTSASSSGGGGGGGNYPTPTGQGTAYGVGALKSAAKPYGWDTGSQWTSLNYVEMREAGYNPRVKNASSGALGLAQALGHGNANTAGSLGNEYGGYGLTDAQAKQANSGNAYWQAVWMVNYIHDRYGTPAAAAAHESANNWY